MHWGQPIPCITEGNQKWTGAAPIFKRRALKITVLGSIEITNNLGAAAKIKADPKAWIRKYFRAASDEYKFDFDVMRGMKESRFSSSPSQAVNHEEEEKAIKVPVRRESINNNRAGWIVKI